MEGIVSHFRLRGLTLITLDPRGWINQDFVTIGKIPGGGLCMYVHVGHQEGMWTIRVMEKGLIRWDSGTIISTSSVRAVTDLGLSEG